jgi:Tfp pilus assembly protein PilV
MTFPSLKNKRGVSLIETMAAVLIISFSVIGLVSSFIYGRSNVEQSGLERKALELLQGQMEYWKNARLQYNESRPMPTHPGPATNQTVLLDAEKGLQANLRSEISGKRSDGNLTYQQVTVTLMYDNGPFKDSLGLTTKMYLR